MPDLYQLNLKVNGSGIGDVILTLVPNATQCPRLLGQWTNHHPWNPLGVNPMIRIGSASEDLPCCVYVQPDPDRIAAPVDNITIPCAVRFEALDETKELFNPNEFPNRFLLSGLSGISNDAPQAGCDDYFDEMFTDDTAIIYRGMGNAKFHWFDGPYGSSPVQVGASGFVRTILSFCQCRITGFGGLSPLCPPDEETHYGVFLSVAVYLAAKFEESFPGQRPAGSFYAFASYAKFFDPEVDVDQIDMLSGVTLERWTSETSPITGWGGFYVGVWQYPTIAGVKIDDVSLAGAEPIVNGRPNMCRLENTSNQAASPVTNWLPKFPDTLDLVAF